MIILGDKLIPFIDTSFIKDITAIKNTKANSLVLFDYDEDLLKYCNENSIDFGVVVNSLKQALYVNAFDTNFIICDQNLDESIQNIAENYMFDAKILSIIESNEELETIALKKIDGVIYKNLLKSEA